MNKWFLIGGAAAALVGLAIVANTWFVPEGTQTVDESFPEGMMMEDFTSVKSGAFKDGDSSHDASGTVSILQDKEGYFLRFENYQATSGPDVFFYLTEKAEARSTSDVESGLKILTPGGADGGEATKRGNFNIPLPADFNPDKWNGMTVWCDDFNVVFGTATLQ